MKKRRLKIDVIPLENLFHDVQDIKEVPISKQVIDRERYFIDTVQDQIMSEVNKIDDVQKEACYVEDPHKRVKELEDKVQHLKGVVESSQDKISKDLELQADMFKRLMYEEVQKLEEKLKSTQMKLKTLKVQAKRKNIMINKKMHMLLDVIGEMKVMSSSNYDLFREEFEHLLVELFQNEDKHENKLIHSEQ